MSWFRAFIRRHIVADDPAPRYSRLDHLDRLHEGVPHAGGQGDPVCPDELPDEQEEREDQG